MAAYIPQGTFSGYITPQKNIERRQRLADVLAMQGMDTSPVQSPWQALARVAQAGVGAYGDYKAGQMEQQRFKAMGEAMRGGMTPEQMFGTGDPQMMQLGEFMIEQKRLQMQQDQQNAMFRQMDQTNQRANTELAQNAPGNREAASEAARLQHEKIVRGEAATRFMDKLKGIYGRMGITFDPKTQAPDFSKVRDDLFGQFQGGPGGSIVGGLASAVGLPSSEADRQLLETELQAAAQDYGAMTGIDPQLARRYLPALTSPNAQTAYGGLQSAATNAQRYIDEAGGGHVPGPTVPPPGASESVATAPLAPLGPRHPIQNAPSPQPKVRAGEVPLPGASPQGGGSLPFVPDPKQPWLTPEIWATWDLGKQQLWNNSE